MPVSGSAWLESGLGEGRYDVEVGEGKGFIQEFAFWDFFRLATSFVSQPVLPCRINLKVYMSDYPGLMLLKRVRESLPFCLQHGEGDVVFFSDIVQSYPERPPEPAGILRRLCPCPHLLRSRLQ